MRFRGVARRGLQGLTDKARTRRSFEVRKLQLLKARYTHRYADALRILRTHGSAARLSARWVYELAMLLLIMTSPLVYRGLRAGLVAPVYRLFTNRRSPGQSSRAAPGKKERKP